MIPSDQNDSSPKIITKTITGEVKEGESSGGTSNKLTVYFKNCWNWSNICFFAWYKTSTGTSNFGPSFPGISVSKSASTVNIGEVDWIKYEYIDFVPKSNTDRYIIVAVNKEGKKGYTQTNDLKVEDGWTTVFIDGTKSGNNPVDWKITNYY